MSFRTLGLIFLVYSQVSLATGPGRGPAVEDFVGIEIDHPEQVPQGTENLFNFEKDMNQFEATPVSISRSEISAPANSAQTPLTTGLAVMFILGLPAMIWYMIMSHLRGKAQIESASNIEVLEKYRRERQEARKAQEEFKKVS